MIVIPVDLSPADWSRLISVLLDDAGTDRDLYGDLQGDGARSIASESATHNQTRTKSPSKWFTMGVLIFGIVCLVIGVLMQFYRIESTNPYSAASK